MKRLGRGVQGFVEEVWQAHLLTIAAEVTRQKFCTAQTVEALRGTGTAVIAEAAPRDCVWGIGFGRQNPKAMDPRAWRGTNVLGWGLMMAREGLGGLGVPRRP